MKIDKRVIAVVLALCLFVTNDLQAFAEVIETKQEQTIEKEREVFDYPKANVYSEIKEDEQQIQIDEEQEKTQEDTADSVEENSDLLETPQEQPEEENTEQTEKIPQEPTTDASKEQEGVIQESQPQEDAAQENPPKEEKDKQTEAIFNNEEKEQSKQQKLELPSIEDEEDELDVLYGEPIQVTQYTKVYKTPEGTYKTIYSDIPNTYVDSEGQEKEIDNTLEPVTEEKIIDDKKEPETEEKTIDDKKEPETEEKTIDDKKEPETEEKTIDDKKEPETEEKTIDDKKEPETEEKIIDDKKEATEQKSEFATKLSVFSNTKQATPQVQTNEAGEATVIKDEAEKAAEVTNEAVEDENATDNADADKTDTGRTDTEITDTDKTDTDKTDTDKSDTEELVIEEQVTDASKEQETKENTIQDKEKNTEPQTEEVITAYTNVSNDMVVTLPANGSDTNGITLSKNDFSLTLYPMEGDYSKAAVKENAILYNQVFDNIHIQYTVETFGIKEDIILNERTKRNEYSYRFSKEGLYAKLIDNVVYIFKGEDNIPSMTLEAPVMTDELGAESTDITLNLAEKEEDYIVTMTANQEWLDSQERLYPIHIDPSINTIDKQIVIYSICSESNFLSSTVGYVGSSSDYGKSRSYIIVGYWFNDIIPEDAVVTDAKLQIYQYAGNEKGNITCYRLEKALNHKAGIDGMTWESSVNINREVAGENSNFKSKIGKHEIDIKDTVSRWIQGIAPVHGLVLIADKEAKTNAEFYTNESAGIKKSKKPKIVIDWKYEGELDENNYSLDATTVNLRTLIESNLSGKHLFHGVYADGEAKPGATVTYELNDAAKNFNSSVLAGYYKVFPNSSATNSLFPSGTTKYKDKLSNWQTMLPFVNFDFNVLYQINATAAKDNVTGKKAESETFLIYKVTQFDTLPKIAKYYGVPLSQMLYDNKAADTLVVKNNTLFIRNPKKNANKPYNPPKLTDDSKAQIDSLLMGRGLHCKFGFEPINLNTGNFYMEQTDASITDETKQFAITRSYNAKGSTRNSSFGRGWQFNYEEQLSKDENENIIYSRGDGSSLTFQKNGNTYTPPEGYDDSLEERVVGTRTVNMGKKDKAYSVYEYTITDHSNTKRIFNEYGYLTQIIDAKGNTITLTYDANYFLQAISSSTGFTYHINCNENGNITAIQLPDGNTLTYGYDDSENLTSFTNELGITLHYCYDDAHRMTEWYDGSGDRVVSNTYDSEDRVTRQVDANNNECFLTYQDGKTITTDGTGAQTIYSYDDQHRTTKITYPNGSSVSKSYSGNQLTAETDVLGHQTVYEYDASGNMTKETRFDGASKSYSYNSQNLLLSETDYAGNLTAYEYDGNSNLIKITKPDNRSIYYTYDTNNHVTEMKDAKGLQTTFTYQGPWVHSIIDAMGQTQTFSYDGKGDIISFTDKAGNTTTYQYDSAGRKVKEINPAGKSTDYTYDNAGNITAIVDYNGGQTSFTHDKNGNIVTLTDPMGRVYHYEYDANGNKTKEINPKGEAITYAYDSMGHQISAANAEGQTIQYEYDVAGNKVKEIDANGNATSYEYDYRCNQVSLKTDPLGAQIATAYSVNGLPIKQTDENGEQVTFEYDAANRMTKYEQEGGLVTNLGYDSNDNLTQMISSDGKKYFFVYDALNQMIAQTLPNTGTILYAYDAAGNLIKQTDALGNETAYKYDKIGNLTAVTDALGHLTTFAYDNNSNLIQTTDSLGNTTKNCYDLVNQLTQTVDQRNFVTKISYDEAGNTTAITNALNGTTAYEFNKRGLVVKVIDANGNRYDLEYDSAGNNTKIVAPNQSFLSYTYDSRNHLIESSDSEGLKTSYQYDKKGQLLKEENSAGECKEYTYDAFGNITSLTNSLGQKTTYTYDVSKNLTSVTALDGNTTQYEYDKMGNVIKITDSEGKAATYEYDKNNRLISKEDALLRTYQYTYDQLGNLTSDTNPLGEKNSYQYDLLGNLTQVQDAAGAAKIFEYDSTGNLLSQKDQNGNKTSFTYDALGQVIAVEEADKSKQEYLYDALGNLIKYQDAAGNVTNYTYDSVSQLTQLTTPNGGSYAYTYDGHGNTTTVTDPLGGVTQLEYDQNNQAVKRSLPNGAQYSYAYDQLGRLTKLEAPENQTRQYAYDSVGDLIQESDQAGRVVSYTYDKQHRLLTTTNEENATTSYTYDDAGNLSSVVSPLGSKTTYTYDVLDRITTQTDPVGKVTELTYDIVGNLTKLTENGGRSTQYGYDPVGNQTSVTNALLQTTSYEYDNKNQVTGVIDAAGQKTSYEYDKIGQKTAITNAKGNSLKLTYDGNQNLTSIMDEEGRSIAYAYDLADRITKVTDGDGIETTYTYDSVGNLESVTDANQNTTSYTYDLLGRMTSTTNPLSEILEFTYDIEGRLKEEKQQDGTTIQYDYNQLDQLVAIDYGKEHEKENVLYAYDSEGRKISMEDVTGTTSYEYDEAGRIALVRTSDQKEIHYEYDSYANLSKLIYPDGKTVTYTYDALDRLTVLTDRNKKETHYTYDEAGNLIQIKRPNQTVTKLTYDVLNQVTLVENQNAKGKVLSSYTYCYDNSGFITEEEETQYQDKDKINIKSSFTYDLRGQLTKVVKRQDKKETDIRYTYDQAGNRICIEKSEDTIKKQWTENTYNEANRLISSKDSKNGTTIYEYDQNGNMVKELAPGEEEVSYYYDVENRLNSVKEQGTLLMAALYDGDGNRIFTVERTSESYEETIAEHKDFVSSEQSMQKPVEYDTCRGVFTWDKVTESIKKTFIRRDTQTTATRKSYHQQAGDQTKEVTVEEKAKEKADNPSYAPNTEIEETRLYVDPSVNIFWYGFGQALIQSFSGAPQYLSNWFREAWDYINNQYYIVRHTKTIEYQTTASASVSEENETSLTREEAKPKWSETTQTDVRQSNPKRETDTKTHIKSEKQYEEGSALIPKEELEELSGYEKALYETVLIPSGTDDIERENYQMTSYVNDVNQEHTQVLMEYDVNDKAASVYDYGAQRNSYTNLRDGASQTQYYLYDGQGSVSALTSVHATPTVTYQYDAYGVAQVSGETDSPYGYNAEAVDTNTGLQYLRARYYNSSIGGFLTQDTDTGSLEDPLTQNLYTYTGNNPVNYVDPSGHSYHEYASYGSNSSSSSDLSPNTMKATAGIGDIVSMPGEIHIKSEPTKTVKTTAGISDYLHFPGEVQVESEVSVDPVTQSLENRYGEVTTKTDSYAYAGGLFVTAFGEAERIMCELANHVNLCGNIAYTQLPETLKQVVEFFSGFVDSIATNMNLPGEHNHASYEEALKEAYYNGAVAGDVVSIITGVILTVAGTAETVAGGIGDIFGAVISMSGAGAAAGIPTIAISTDVLITGIAEMAYGISISMTATDNLAGDIKKAQEAAENTDVSKGGSDTEWHRMTSKESEQAAKKLGYEKTNYKAKNGERIYYNKKTKTYISQDVGSADGSGAHNGGVWKMAKSPTAINSKSTRLGTYDAKLNRIGD